MADQPDIQFTDFDYWSSEPRLQMLKAALPFMDLSQQRTLSLLVRVQELQHTMNLYGQLQDPEMGICALERPASSPIEMLQAIRPYAPARDQDFIDVVINFIQGFRIRQNYQELQAASAGGDGNHAGREGEINAPFPFEQLKAFLSPSQQAQLEHIQLIIQAMQAF